MAKILYAEDEPLYSDLVIDQMDRIDKGLDIISVDNGREAIERFSADEFDCIVSDYEMPRMDGLELLEVIREAYPKFPFILFTGKGSEEIASEAITKGVTDYLRKGGDKSTFTLLANRVCNAIKRYSAIRENERLATRFTYLEKASPDAFWDRDIVTDTVELGLGFKLLFGHEPGRIENSFSWWYDKVHPDDRDQVVEEIERVIEAGDNFYQGELQFRCADGTYKPIVGRGYILYEHDTPVREIGLAISSTRRQANTASQTGSSPGERGSVT